MCLSGFQFCAVTASVAHRFPVLAQRGTQECRVYPVAKSNRKGLRVEQVSFGSARWTRAVGTDRATLCKEVGKLKVIQTLRPATRY